MAARVPRTCLPAWPSREHLGEREADLGMPRLGTTPFLSRAAFEPNCTGLQAQTVVRVLSAPSARLRARSCKCAPTYAVCCCRGSRRPLLEPLPGAVPAAARPGPPFLAAALHLRNSTLGHSPWTDTCPPTPTPVTTSPRSPTPPRATRLPPPTSTTPGVCPSLLAHASPTLRPPPPPPPSAYFLRCPWTLFRPPDLIAPSFFQPVPYLMAPRAPARITHGVMSPIRFDGPLLSWARPSMPPPLPGIRPRDGPATSHGAPARACPVAGCTLRLLRGVRCQCAGAAACAPTCVQSARAYERARLPAIYIRVRQRASTPLLAVLGLHLRPALALRMCHRRTLTCASLMPGTHIHTVLRPIFMLCLAPATMAGHTCVQCVPAVARWGGAGRAGGDDSRFSLATCQHVQVGMRLHNGLLKRGGRPGRPAGGLCWRLRRAGKRRSCAQEAVADVEIACMGD